jgi:phosphatidylethanolamine-binding protein (PEBP) family uncharacterized protein
LLALDTPALDLDGDAKVADVEAAARKHMLAEAELVGHYEREG